MELIAIDSANHILTWVFSLRIWGFASYAVAFSMLVLVGGRIACVVKPDAPYGTPIIQLAGVACATGGVVMIIVALLLVIALTVLALLGGVVTQLWIVSQGYVYAIAGGVGMGVVVSLPFIFRIIPGWERGSGLADVTEVIDEFKHLQGFDPRKYFNFAKGCFIGKDQRGSAVYVPWRKLRETHLQVLGTTGSGKGVVMSLIAYQCVLAGETLIWVDPKHDRYSPRLMQAAAREAGKAFYLVDLNADVPQINLLKGATSLEIADIFVAGFDLRGKGTDADFYRGKDEDAAIAAGKIAADRKAMSIPELFQACSQDETITTQENFWRRFLKLAQLPVFNTQHGVDLPRAMTSGAVIYVLGSTDSERVRTAQKMLLVRFLQLIKKRDRATPQNPVCVILDEFKHLLSPSALTALGVVRDFDAHCLLAHQSLGDLHDCAGIEPSAAYGAVIDNTALKIIYRINDSEHAERLSKLAGQTRTHVDAVSKTANGGAPGAGQWREAQRYLVSPDLITHLPVPSDRPKQASVGILMGMGNAKVFYVGPLAAKGESPVPQPALPVCSGQESLLGEALI